MCGICGFSIQTSNPKPAKTIIKQMCDVMIPRGPDDWGYYQDSHMVLGMRRLSIIDLVTGHQPIANEDRTVILVCNGEIYNFRELKLELIDKGHSFSTQSDVEVIAHLYEEEGCACLQKLNGMFGLALWDSRKKRLFIARDRLGIKPLHFMHLPDGTFVFASELKALLKYPRWEHKINPMALHYYLTYENVPAPYTIFSNVFKVMPGQYLIYQNKEIFMTKYWELNYLGGYKNLIKESDAQEQFLHLLSESVRYRMISDVPLGVFLSGGVDSSMVSAFAQRHTSDFIDSFNIGFHEESYDESGYARQVASHLNLTRRAKIRHHEEIFNTSRLLALLPEVVQCMDEPLGDPSLLPTYLLSKFARQHVKVALSGDGGDELFAGYPTYQAHVLARFYLYLPKIVRSRFIECLIQKLTVSDKNFSFDFRAKRFISGMHLPAPLRHTIWMGALSPEEKASLYHHELQSLIKNLDTFEPVKEFLQTAKVDNSLDTILCLDMKLYLQDGLLVKLDRASMASSLEVRVPFLDHHIVDFVTKLPPSFKLKWLKSKYLLKKCGKTILPKRVIHRKKKGFGIPVSEWIRGQLYDLFQDMLSDDRIKREGLFNPHFIGRLLDDHVAGRYNNRKSLWTLFMFEQWVASYLGGTPTIDDKSPSYESVTHSSAAL